MGLSGRKSKQRIGHDPRNLTWANDANKFGAAYLEKFGWASGSGLGAAGEGRTKHISVYQKLDMLGIGADHRNSQEGTAWKQGKDFENLLRRLNAGGVGEDGAADVPKIDGFVKPTEGAEDGAEESVEESKEDERKSKKRKRAEEDDEAREDEDDDEERRRRKKERKERKAKEKEEKAARKASKKQKRKEDESVSKDERKKRSSEPIGDEETAPSTTTAVAATPKAPVVVPRPMRAHRARHIAMKGLASKSPTAIAEILGIPSSSGTPTGAQSDSLAPSVSTTAVDSPAADASAASAGLKMHDLTTSSKSVMDYFREKLAAKSTRSSEASTPTAVASPAAEDYNDRPRGGLGLGASRLRVEAAVEVDEYEERPRGGLGASRLAMSMGMMSFVQSTSQTTFEQGEGGKAPEVGDDGKEDVDTKKSKKSKKRKQEEDNGDNGVPIPAAEENTTFSVEKKKKKRKADAPADGDDVREEAEVPPKKKHKKKTSQADNEAPPREQSKKRKKKHEVAEL